MLQLKRLVDAKLQINVISSSTTLHETRDEVGRAAMTDSHAVVLFHPSFRIAIYRSLATATLLYNVYAGWTRLQQKRERVYGEPSTLKLVPLVLERRPKLAYKCIEFILLYVHLTYKARNHKKYN